MLKHKVLKMWKSGAYISEIQRKLNVGYKQVIQIIEKQNIKNRIKEKAMKKLKELNSKLQKHYSEMSFKLENNTITCEYQNGLFVFTDVSDGKIFGITVQYKLQCRNNPNETEILKCINEINSEHNLLITLDNMAGCINFAPIHVPMFRDEKELVESGLTYFNRQKHFLTILESDSYYKKLKELLK